LLATNDSSEYVVEVPLILEALGPYKVVKGSEVVREGKDKVVVVVACLREKDKEGFLRFRD